MWPIASLAVVCSIWMSGANLPVPQQVVSLVGRKLCGDFHQPALVLFTPTKVFIKCDNDGSEFSAVLQTNRLYTIYKLQHSTVVALRKTLQSTLDNQQHQAEIKSLSLNDEGWQEYVQEFQRTFGETGGFSRITDVTASSILEFKMRVLDKDGQPVPFATVSCNRGPKETADAKGAHTFLIEEMSRSVELEAWHHGHHFWGIFPVADGVHTVKLE